MFTDTGSKTFNYKPSSVAKNFPGARGGVDTGAVCAGEDDPWPPSSLRSETPRWGDNRGTSTLQGPQSYTGSWWERDRVSGYEVRFPLGSDLV